MKKNNRLSQNVEMFIQDRRASNLSKRSIQWYQQSLDKFLKYCDENGIEETESITPQFIRSYLLHLQEKGHSEGGIHGFYRGVRTFLNFYENEFEPENWKNPIKKVKPPRVSIEPLEGVGIETVQSLIGLCDKSTFYGVRNSTILMVLLETGIRASELLQIDIEDIDFQDSSILVKQGKGRKPRNVFVGQQVRRQIRRYLKFRDISKGALFVTRQGSRLNYYGLRDIIKSLSTRLGIKEVGIHSFRRTWAIEMLKKGVDIQTIARLLGHTSLNVISRYLRQTKGDLGTSFKSLFDS